MHIKAVNQCVHMVENIEILLSYNNLSVNEILNNLSSNNSLTLLDFIDRISSNLTNEISDYVLSEQNKNILLSNKYLDKNDKENLINFFSTFGCKYTKKMLTLHAI